jgi:hypothetical protein
MHSPRPSVMAVISLKASLFTSPAHFQWTAVCCVFSVLQIIRWHVCTLRTADRRESVCTFYINMILKVFTNLKMAYSRSKHVELLNKTELFVFRHISNLYVHFILSSHLFLRLKMISCLQFSKKNSKYIFLLNLVDLITQICGHQ